MPVIGSGISGAVAHCHGSINWVSGAATECDIADQYEDVVGTFSGNNDVHFSTAADGLVTFSGADNSDIQFTGVANLQSDKICNADLTLEINDSPSVYTTHFEFTAPNKIKNIAIVGMMVLNNGDTLRAIIRSDTILTDFTFTSLNGVFWGTGE